MVSMQINSHGLETYFEGLPSGMFGIAKQAVAGAVSNTHRKVKRNTTLHRRTGELMRSIHTKVKGETFAELSGSVYSAGVPYAAIQETGGTITAKRAYRGVTGGAYLNIPLTANKTASGVMRKTAKQVFQAGGTIIHSRRGNYIVIDNIGTPMFVLKKQVTIPARLGMMDAADGEIPLLMSRLREAFRGVL